MSEIRITPCLDDVDEIFAKEATVHFEYMDDNDIYLSISKGETEYHFHIQTPRAKIKTWGELVSESRPNKSEVKNENN